MQRTLFLLLTTLLAALPFRAAADDTYPSVSPTMNVTGDDLVDEETTEYDGNAPMYAVFRANPEDIGDYEALYEWRFTRLGEEQPFLVRYDEDTEYNFTQSGTYNIELRVSFVLDADTLEYTMDEPFSVNISESRLEVPNAFTPNGDGTNDTFKVKEHQSIVEFRAMVFNRWGKKVYEWNDPEGEWDGRSGGRDCPDGAYYLNIQAKGADGRKYNIKKTINILRGFQQNSGTLE